MTSSVFIRCIHVQVNIPVVFVTYTGDNSLHVTGMSNYVFVFGHQTKYSSHS